jgi:aldehyde dehydrogenase (NAD+)
VWGSVEEDLMDVARIARQYLGGEWCGGSGEKVLVDRNPFDDTVIAEIPVATAQDIDTAYRAAEQAQQAWEETSAYARRTVFEEAARIVGERSDEIRELIIAEVGGTALKAF